MQKCPQCGSMMPSDAAFCDQCGMRLTPQPAPQSRAPVAQRCPQCGAAAVAGQAFCEQCGHALGGRAAAYKPSAPATAPAQRCAQCNAPLGAGDTFCPQCGHRSETGAAGAPPAAPVEPPPRPPGAHLIMQSNGSAITLPAKEVVVIGREDPMSDQFPDIDLTPFGGGEQGVSRQHARIMKREDGYFIEDLGSMNFTFVNQMKLERGQPRPLQFGDIVRFGRVTATFQEG